MVNQTEYTLFVFLTPAPHLHCKQIKWFLLRQEITWSTATALGWREANLTSSLHSVRGVILINLDNFKFLWIWLGLFNFSLGGKVSMAEVRKAAQTETTLDVTSNTVQWQTGLSAAGSGFIVFIVLGQIFNLKTLFSLILPQLYLSR